MLQMLRLRSSRRLFFVALLSILIEVCCLNNNNNIEAFLNRMSFGYESSTAPAIPLPKNTNTALCYPKEVRPRGCDHLLQQNSSASAMYIPSNLKPLPCVADGRCPYLFFRCEKGHEWKAIPGSPVCFVCPECNRARQRTTVEKRIGIPKIKKYLTRRHITRRKGRVQDIAAALHQHAKSRNGSILATDVDNQNSIGSIETTAPTLLRMSSRVRCCCHCGHSWDAYVSNLLLQGQWCGRCRYKTLSLSELEFHRTASHFSGAFLGFEDALESKNENNGERDVSISGYMKPATSMPQQQAVVAPLLISRAKKPKQLSQRRAIWSCSVGHVFVQTANNIRRLPGQSRQCSWCPECTKTNGSPFEWKPIG